MESENKQNHPLNYATAQRRKSRLPSPWLIPTLAGNPLVWFVVTIGILVLAVFIRIIVREVQQ